MTQDLQTSQTATPENRTRKSQRSSRKGPPKAPTPARLERWAHHYLQRYASSAANLKVILMRRVRRHASELQTDVEAAEAEIDALVTRLVERRYIDDRAFAATLTSKLRARGSSTTRIRAQLRSKGVETPIVDELLTSADTEAAEFAAATGYSRRRRLGPFRPDPEVRRERRERDLAALGRAGFSYEIARRIIEAEE
jgi:regulatory protein